MLTVNIPEIFSLLIGRRLSVFAHICESEAPISSQMLAEATDIKTATARSLLRNMAYAGLVARRDGSFEGGKGRHPDLFVVKPEVKEWWRLTQKTFGGAKDGGENWKVQERQDDR